MARSHIPLRWLFVLILVGAALLPMGVVGFWLNRQAARSGEELLRGRLEESLRQTAADVGTRWLEIRSGLVDLGEHPAVLASLARPVSEVVAADPDELGRLVAGTVTRVTVHSLDGVEILRVEPEIDGTNPDPWVVVELALFEPPMGPRVGTLRARVRWTALTRGQPPQAFGAGAFLGVLSLQDGRSVLPPPLDPGLMRQTRFDVGAEAWVGASRTLSEPALELIMAAPLDPFQQPFLEATRRGTVALVLVALASLVLVTLLTGRIANTLRSMATAADAVAAGDLAQELPEAGGRELAHVAVAFNAMTERLQATLQELASRKSLAAVGEFATSLAHEVRNPLSSVRLDLQVAKEEIGDGPGSRLVGDALRSVERLDHTVTGALRIARSGKVALRPVELMAAVAGALHGADVEFKRGGLRIERAGAFPNKVHVLGDAAALEQVLLNVLLNAAQAATLEVRIGVAVGPSEVVITIVDDGPGVPVEDRERIFDPFVSTKEDGTGLGLPMARTIVTAHGGRIVVEGTPAGGATFLIGLPIRAGSATVT